MSVFVPQEVWCCVWDEDTHAWVSMTQPGGSGGGTVTQGPAGAEPWLITGAVTGPLTDAQLRAVAVPVSGTFYQATQPVSGTVGVSGSVAVTGAFYQVTQPVSLASAPTTPVTGTFWQTTQPVSGPLTDTQIRATPLPVSGTVSTGGLTDTQIRATPLPVSGTVAITAAALPLPSGASQEHTTAASPSSVELSDGSAFYVGAKTGQLPTALAANGGMKIEGVASGVAVPVSGTFYQATQPVSATQLPAALAANGGMKIEGVASGVAVPMSYATTGSGTATGAIRVELPTNGTGILATVGAVTAITNALPAGTNAIGKLAANSGVIIGDVNVVAVPTLTKGTQGSTGFSTQDLKDAGRVSIIFSVTAAASGSTGTETAISLTKSAGTGATSSATSFVVTSGKRFRISQMLVSAVGHVTATTQATTFSLRMNTAGAVTTTSTPILWKGRIQTPATSLAYQQVSFAIPDGYEILGDGTLQIGMTANAVFTTNAPTWDVTLVGFEY